MKFKIAEAVFANPLNDLDLLGLLGEAKVGRIYLALNDPMGGTYATWRARQAQHIIELWDLMVEWTVSDEALYTMATIVVEDVNTSVWGNIPSLTIADARQLARTGVSLLIENSRNDRAFILSMADDATRALLLHLEHAQALRFVGLGGIGEIKAYLEAFVVPHPGNEMKYFALFDGDAEAPGLISSTAASVNAECERCNVPYHCLRRRAIENYIPVGAVFDYVNGSKRTYRAYLRVLAETLKSLNGPQRAHFPMKAGIKAMSQAQQVLYGGLDPRVRKVLERRFPDKMAASVYTDSPSSRLVMQIGTEPEKDEVRNMLLRLLYYARGPYAR